MERKILRVFLGSPSDVGEERDLVDAIVDEINETHANSLAARLELLRWETHTVPDIGTDAQDSVNRQIGDDYDVFIGVLWTRFGTPTPRARSGTEEEYRRALAKKAKNQAVEVLFYFKTASVPYNVDLEQLKLVRDFKSEIQDEGLIRNYEVVVDFERNVRMALNRFVLAPLFSVEATPAQEPQVPFATPVEGGTSSGEMDTDTELEDAGLFDLVDQANESLSSIGEITKDLSSGLEVLTKRMSSATSRIDGLGIEENPAAAKGATKIINSLGETMELYAARLEGQVAPFQEANSRAFGAMMGIAELAPDFGESSVEALVENVNQLRGLRESTEGAKETLEELKETIDSQPRITRKFNRSKRRLVAALTSFGAAMGATIGMSVEAEMLTTSVVVTLGGEVS